MRRSAPESSTSKSSGDLPDLLTPSVARQLARDHGITPRKSLGQNFVVDPNTITRIVRLAEVGPGDRVFEVGAGLGSLTLGLAGMADRVVALETDRKLVGALTEATIGHSNVSVVHGDVMSVEIGSILEGSGWRMISNLPYHLAAAVTADMLESPEVAPIVDDFVLLVQKEVASRLTGSPGSKDYAAITLLVEYHAVARRLGDVPRSVFWPKPKVDSTLVRLTRRRESLVDVSWAQMKPVVKAAFGQRRKSVRNSLSSGLGLEASDVADRLAEAGVDSKARAETLTLTEFARVALALG